MIERERVTFEKYEAQGYDIIKAGAPDLILLKDGAISFIEVKSKIDKLSEHQERAFNLLQKHGFNAKVEVVTLKPKPRRPAPSPRETISFKDDSLFMTYFDLPQSERLKYTCGADWEANR